MLLKVSHKAIYFAARAVEANKLPAKRLGQPRHGHDVVTNVNNGTYVVVMVGKAGILRMHAWIHINGRFAYKTLHNTTKHYITLHNTT